MRLLVGLILWGLLLAPAMGDEAVCADAAERMAEAVPEWADMLAEYGASEKNKHILKMNEDISSGDFGDKFKARCASDYADNSALYECFAGVRSWTGAASCMHPDTNPNEWTYD